MKLSKDTAIDLKRLVVSRLLINANSGGGKSWAIRRLLEQSHGQIQQIVIDLEGEFVTLREKYDYLLVGQNGEIPISIRTAELLARRLLELNVSTILDLSELKHPERITFVKRFLDSLVNAPKNLWHPALIVVDEAHQFCPEKSSAESSSAVIDLMTRGRKRKFCGVLATQRVSKLHKDAVAECNNYMIGRTGLDIDMKRASEILGFTTKEDFRSLRDLEAGEFYTFGPAFSHKGIKRDKVGEVKTTHEITNVQLKTPIKTPANIQKILKDITDLPKQAEEELRTVADYKKRITELKMEVAVSKRGHTTMQVDALAIEKAHQKGFEGGLNQGRKENRAISATINELHKRLLQIGKIAGQDIKVESSDFIAKVVMPKQENVSQKRAIEPRIERENVLVNRNIQENDSTEEGPMGKGEESILNAIAQFTEEGITTEHIAVLTEYKATSRREYLRKLVARGYITRSGELYHSTYEGREALGDKLKPLPMGAELREFWLSNLPEGEKKIFSVIIEAYPEAVDKEVIMEVTGYRPTSVREYLRKLSARKIVSVENGGVKAHEKLYE
jgi:hypothetical protein